MRTAAIHLYIYIYIYIYNRPASNGLKVKLGDEQTSNLKMFAPGGSGRTLAEPASLLKIKTPTRTFRAG